MKPIRALFFLTPLLAACVGSKPAAVSHEQSLIVAPCTDENAVLSVENRDRLTDRIIEIARETLPLKDFALIPKSDAEEMVTAYASAQEQCDEICIRGVSSST
jgi:hypothetical protein